jgi:hypothetical protein
MLSYHDLLSLVNSRMLRYCGKAAKNGRYWSVFPLNGDPSGGALISLRHTRSFPRDPTYDRVTELLRKTSRCIVAWK